MPAIVFNNVSKTYKRYASYKHSFMDTMGLGRWITDTPTLFKALDNISFSIKKGEKVGILGRNGAGKTTLLKLVTQNFQPTHGIVKCRGTVQSLMQMGLGFHEDMSGWNNIRSSLLFNNIPKSHWTKTIDDILDFVELDDFIHAPFKTYSLGMKARLEFAVATSIHPDILIIDEVLGAGDGYFSNKSAQRMKNLTQKGCTLLMVSHSVSQLQSFCDRGLWLEKGKMVKMGDLDPLTKEYLESIEKHYNNLSDSHKNNNYFKEGLNPIQTYDVLTTTIYDLDNVIGTFSIKGYNNGKTLFQPGDRCVLTYTPFQYHHRETLDSICSGCTIAFLKDDHIPIFKIHIPSLYESFEKVMDPFILGGGEYHLYVDHTLHSCKTFEKLGAFSLYHANDTTPPLFYHPVTLKINDNFVNQVFDSQQ